jgi:hypothetical protein
VFVGAADMDDITLFQPLVPHVNIRGKVRAGKVTEMDLPIRIRKRARNQNLHGEL